MKDFNLKNFLLGCLTGILILTAKYYYEKNQKIQSIEVESIGYVTPK